MTKVYTGRDGQMWLNKAQGGAQLAKVTSYQFQASLDALDATSLGDNQRIYVPGVQSFTGNATLLYYKDETGKTSANRLLRRLIRSGTGGVTETTDAQTSDLVRFTLRLVDGEIYSDIEFNAWITNATIGATVGEIVSAQVSFTVTGALTTSNLSI